MGDKPVIPPKSNRKARSATASDGFRLLDGVDCNVKVEIGPGIPLVAQTVVALRPLLAVGLGFNDTSASAASPAGTLVSPDFDVPQRGRHKFAHKIAMIVYGQAEPRGLGRAPSSSNRG